MIRYKKLLILLLAPWLMSAVAGCGSFPLFKVTENNVPERGQEGVLTLTFGELPGWEGASLKQSLEPFVRSCRVRHRTLKKAGSFVYEKGKVSWGQVCEKAEALIFQNPSPNDIKTYFEKNFYPHLITLDGKDSGLITGYFEPLLFGSFKKTTRFNVPLYKKPDNLVSVSLGDFQRKWKGKKIVGQVKNSRLKPYFTREQIERGQIDGNGLELIWVDSLIDAFFLHIQGSGLIELPSGKIVRVGYAGKNGHSYFAIGRELVNRGILAKEEISLQSIRSWLIKNPNQAESIMHLNKSFVFFKVVNGPGPIGSQGVPLTPGYSLAVDRRYVPLGAPIWLDTVDPLNRPRPLRRLVIAQDTGGAIKGANRGDLFWGRGIRARSGAGLMKEKGKLYILLPRPV